MNRVVALFLASFLLLGILFCGKKEVVYSQEDQKSFLTILEANDAILLEFLKETPKPNWTVWKASLNNLASPSAPLATLVQSILVITPEDSEPIEEQLEKVGKIQELLLAAKESIPSTDTYSKFYCPMVEKRWIMSGRAIRNPFAPEMRDCGELIP